MKTRFYIAYGSDCDVIGFYATRKLADKAIRDCAPIYGPEDECYIVKHEVPFVPVNGYIYSLQDSSCIPLDFFESRITARRHRDSRPAIADCGVHCHKIQDWIDVGEGVW